ncbi:MAG TPA: VOC family protein, partial [Thermoanaerobaculia bacterium]|nr:VOC family protein [Thermoanaerobaculia bacterium]
MRAAVFACALELLVAPPDAGAAPSPPRLELDHVWIMVTPQAPEREALERIGLRVSPDVNRHEGQGTASVMVEFPNAFLELMWPDAGVSIAPGSEKAAEKFRNRMRWRESGWCPVGIGLRRTKSPETPLPFPTWSIAPAWLPAGASIEMLTPREDTRSPSLFISPRDPGSAESPDPNAVHLGKAESDPVFQHPNRARRLSRIRLAMPPAYVPIEPLKYLEATGVLSLSRGDAWGVELVL